MSMKSATRRGRFSWHILENGLASARLSERCCAEGANERIAHQAREGAHQQWSRAAGRLPCVTPDLLFETS
jgi:hypothetical protein